MGRFLEKEKGRQEQLKLTLEWPQWLSAASAAPGPYKGKDRPFCLPDDRRQENLFPGVRDLVLGHFASHAIAWHDGATHKKPSTHLCDSQVCCVNFLAPFMNRPDALASLLAPYYPELKSMEPLGGPGTYVDFEVIGEKNYLGERVPKGGTRARGANVTSADAAVRFIHTDNLRQTVLIEWKYTESYARNIPLHTSASGTDRTAIYLKAWEQDGAIDHDLLCTAGGYGSLFYEPFYQLMRQQLLAHQMELAHEDGADIVSVLHIAPAVNVALRRVTSPALEALGSDALEVWKRLTEKSGRFLSVTTEAFFQPVLGQPTPDLNEWRRYIGWRYAPGWPV